MYEGHLQTDMKMPYLPQTVKDNIINIKFKMDFFPKIMTEIRIMVSLMTMEIIEVMAEVVMLKVMITNLHVTDIAMSMTKCTISSLRWKQRPR